MTCKKKHGGDGDDFDDDESKYFGQLGKDSEDPEGL